MRRWTFVRARSRVHSTRHRTLLRLRLALLAAALLAGTCCQTFLLTVDDAADAVAERSAPAILKIEGARLALVRAHNAALASFRHGHQIAGGPGADFQAQITLAQQLLTQVAEANAAGDDGSRDIEIIVSLLTGYTALIGRANGHYYQGDSEYPLVLLRLQDASDSLTEILKRLDVLRGRQDTALTQQTRSGGWPDLPWRALWLLPVVLLLTLLLTTQVFLRRRFHRVVNVWLLLATMLAVLIGGVTMIGFRSAQQLDDVDAARQTFSTAMRTQVDDLNKDNVTAFQGLAARSSTAPASVQATTPSDDVTAQVQAAANSRSSEIIIAGCAVVLILLIWAGLHTRIREYRYQP